MSSLSLTGEWVNVQLSVTNVSVSCPLNCDLLLRHHAEKIHPRVIIINIPISSIATMSASPSGETLTEKKNKLNIFVMI